MYRENGKIKKSTLFDGQFKFKLVRSMD